MDAESQEGEQVGHWRGVTVAWKGLGTGEEVTGTGSQDVTSVEILNVY